MAGIKPDESTFGHELLGKPRKPDGAIHGSGDFAGERGSPHHFENEEKAKREAEGKGTTACDHVSERSRCFSGYRYLSNGAARDCLLRIARICPRQLGGHAHGAADIGDKRDDQATSTSTVLRSAGKGIRHLQPSNRAAGIGQCKRDEGSLSGWLIGAVFAKGWLSP